MNNFTISNISNDITTPYINSDSMHLLMYVQHRFFYTDVVRYTDLCVLVTSYFKVILRNIR